MSQNAFMKPQKQSMGQQMQPLVLPIVTAMGAFGGFPEPPHIFKKFIKNKIVQYLLLFLLIWQGGGGQNWKLSVKVTVVIFVLITVMNMYEKKKREHFSYKVIKKSLKKNHNLVKTFIKDSKKISLKSGLIRKKNNNSLKGKLNNNSLKG